MNNVITIMRRELSSYFFSPIIYIMMTVFVLIYGVFFVGIFLQLGLANLQYTFSNLVIVFLFLIPIMTMRSLAEERKQGTDEFLMTSPTTSTEIVLGKLLALTISFLIIMATVLIHLVIVLTMAQPDLGPIVASLIGLFLLGFTFIAIGLFTSSLSDNQIIAGVLSFSILLLLWLVEWLADSFSGVVGKIFSSISLIKYFGDFNKGIIDTTNIIFYLSVAALFIFLTIRQVEGRRWR